MCDLRRSAGKHSVAHLQTVGHILVTHLAFCAKVLTKFTIPCLKMIIRLSQRVGNELTHIVCCLDRVIIKDV